MRPVTECNTRLRAARIDVHKFQSTHSITECDERCICNWLPYTTFQSTHSITECDMDLRGSVTPLVHISIHALHYRVRHQTKMLLRARQGISIHALHYRVRRWYLIIICKGLEFQSTHSITECDGLRCRRAACKYYFNPRTPLQSATRCLAVNGTGPSISIHALHYRVRLLSRQNWVLIKQFQSTHSITECDSLT